MFHKGKKNSLKTAVNISRLVFVFSFFFSILPLPYSSASVIVQRTSLIRLVQGFSSFFGKKLDESIIIDAGEFGPRELFYDDRIGL